MLTVNNLVACTPFATTHNEVVKKASGLATNKNTSASGGVLEELTVLMDADVATSDYDMVIKVGTKIYVAADSALKKMQWAINKFDISTLIPGKEGMLKTECIFVPFSEIKVIVVP
jgi:hypothetical protein